MVEMRTSPTHLLFAVVWSAIIFVVFANPRYVYQCPGATSQQD
jgi:hypothetical protein